MMQEYQKTYDAAAIQELIAWFRARMDRLPASIELSESTKITDLPRTVSLYIDLVQKHHAAPIYGGQVLHLFRMREALTAVGIE